MTIAGRLSRASLLGLTVLLGACQHSSFNSTESDQEKQIHVYRQAEQKGTVVFAVAQACEHVGSHPTMDEARQKIEQTLVLTNKVNAEEASYIVDRLQTNFKILNQLPDLKKAHGEIENNLRQASSAEKHEICRRAAAHNLQEFIDSLKQIKRQTQH
ncbi:hypothetical protein [Brackiella oedipodis]|uniref:hypothetical protein n=1 Tax=Brackiella oedipodis TaxID=124225 RepID=UPI00048CF1A1|nr:hypothetical protein [Brackiella oedipodis]